MRRISVILLVTTALRLRTFPHLHFQLPPLHLLSSLTHAASPPHSFVKLSRASSLLLVVIYLGFISLGLPDGTLGVA